MKSTETITRDVWRSTVHPEIATHHPQFGEVIEWADADPRVWRVVMGTKSKEFGRNGDCYFGSERGPSFQQALARASHFKGELERPGAVALYDIFSWRARFTLEHHAENGFRSGFFQQFDGSYARGCLTLDYTPEYLEAIIDRFLAWCDAGYKFPTREVWIDRRVVRTVGGKLDEVEQRASEIARDIKGSKKEQRR